MAIDKIVLQATNNLFTNTEITGTEAARMPIGTTGQRANQQNGDIRFNSTINLMEYYTGSQWKSIDSPPTVTSIDVTTVDSNAGGNQTLVITGSGYASGATVTFVGSAGTDFSASTVTVDSLTQLTVVSPKASFLNAQEPYGVKVENTSGLSATLASQISVDTSPTWSTSSGNLTTITDTATGTHSTVAAVDSDGDTIAYSETTSVLSGAGLSINSSTGAITGDPTDVASSTTKTFTLRAAAGGVNVDRSFNIIITPASDGTTAARAMLSGKAGAVNGAASGTKWVFIEGTAYELTFDNTDKFGDGKVGWVRLNGNFFASNQSLRTSASNIGQAGVTAGYSGNGFYLGDNANSLTSNTSMAYVQMKVPDCTSARMTTITATASGAQSPDDNTNWINSYPGTDTNSYVALKTPTTPNIGGYPFAIWNNASNANYTNGGVIYPKPGTEFTSLATPNSATVNSGFNTASFSSEVDNPKFVCFCGDSGTERLTFTAWEMWVH